MINTTAIFTNSRRILSCYYYNFLELLDKLRFLYYKSEEKKIKNKLEIIIFDIQDKLYEFFNIK